MNERLNERLLDFIAASPSCFHTVAQSTALLEEAGFTRLTEQQRWQLAPGGRYYVTRNGSTIAAFCIGAAEGGFRITASHSDSPCFKLKEQPLRDGGDYTRINCEKYGGTIYSTWLDRPLTVAGRLVLRTERGLQTRLCHVDRDLLLIPNVAIHMNREINKGYAYKEHIDLVPMYAAGSAKGFWDAVAQAAGAEADDIVSHELFVVPRVPGSIWGEDGELISAPRLDDLQCAFATLQGFLTAEPAAGVTMWCCFDNEEVGSRTKQGAGSAFLSDVLRRISLALGRDDEAHLRALADSMLLSADNAHAVHPNHPEYSDPENRVQLNGGVVVKVNAAQSYATDALTSAVVRTLCRRIGIPVQSFANRSDLPGGSTLGNIASQQVSIPMADIGLAQLAMHSSYETAGCRDTEYMTALSRAFYSTALHMDSPEEWVLE